MAQRQDWLSRQGQRRATLQVALAQGQQDVERYYAALVNLSGSPSWEIVVEHWIQTVLLVPPQSERNVGELQFVQRLLADLARAVGKRGEHGYPDHS